jgi:uncharacterized phage-associated protein
METSLSIANHFIQKSTDNCVPLTPMKLLKLVYISHGWYLGLSGKPLISDQVQAWKYGPVVPQLYQYFKKFGDSAITEKAYYQTKEGSYYYTLSDTNLATFLDKVWNVYCNFSGLELSALTHEKDTPWDLIWNKFNGSTFQGAIIPDNIIEQHYKAMVNANRAKHQSN